MKFEVALYTNKQLAPDKKTVLSAFIEFDHNHSAGNAKSELKLTGKGLQKDLSIKMAGNYDLSARLADFTADLDIFDEKADKVQINGKMMLESSATVGYKKTITIDAKSKVRTRIGRVSFLEKISYIDELTHTVISQVIFTPYHPIQGQSVSVSSVSSG